MWSTPSQLLLGHDGGEAWTVMWECEMPSEDVVLVGDVERASCMWRRHAIVGDVERNGG